MMGSVTEEQAKLTRLRASKVFVPRTAIQNRQLFAGRWNQITSVVDSIAQVGLHVVIFGERGVGKTSLANIIKPLLGVLSEESKDGAEQDRLVVRVNCQSSDTFSTAWVRAFEESFIPDPGEPLGFVKQAMQLKSSIAEQLQIHGGQVTNDVVRRIVSSFSASVYIFDEFDRISRESAKPFTDLIKALSDFAVDTTIVLVGVADTVDALVKDHASIVRNVVQIQMPRMSPKELRAILEKGEQELGVTFVSEAAARIIRMSQGLPHYTHLLGQHAVSVACDRQSTTIVEDDVDSACSVAVKDAQQAILSQFLAATRSAHRDALYTHVLIACAIAASRAIDDLGFFQASDVVAPLQAMLPPQRRVDVSTFNTHLVGFCEDKRGPVLERIGSERNYRYRFVDPLLPPYSIMQGLSKKLITNKIVDGYVATCHHDSASNEQLRLFEQ